MYYGGRLLSDPSGIRRSLASSCGVTLSGIRVSSSGTWDSPEHCSFRALLVYLHQSYLPNSNGLVWLDFALV